MSSYLILAEAVAGASDEAKAALLADLAAGRLIAEGIPVFRYSEGEEALPTSYKYECIHEGFWFDPSSDRIEVLCESNCLFAYDWERNPSGGGRGYVHIRIKQEPAATVQPTDQRKKGELYI